MNRNRLEELARRWHRHYVLRAASMALGSSALIAAALIRSGTPLAVATAVVLGACVWFAVRRRDPVVTASTIAAHLDRSCPALEESSALWLKDESTLSLVERLQRQRLDRAWVAQSNRSELGLPSARRLVAATGCSLISIALLLAVIAWPRRGATPVAEAPVNAIHLPPFTVKPNRQGVPRLYGSRLTIVPPAYLNQSVREVEGLDAEVPEGSTVRWSVSTAGDVSALSIDLIGGTAPLIGRATGNGAFTFETTVAETRLYQLVVTRADRSRMTWPEMHSLNVVRDRAPQLTWQLPATARTLVEPSEQPVVTVQLAANDDHGLVDVRLVMTVAKGSGEGVKFREREEPLQATTDHPSERVYSRTFDLKALGLEPGDELYVYAVATDTKTPQPNRTRSETRFVVLRGPDTQLTDPGTTLAGVNLVPQYFRSQRQLIIDTERLLAEQPTLPEPKFRERSEDIGIDQKLLRLRYGQFLGEEFDPESSGAANEARGMERAARLRTGQRTETERANAVERAVEQQHDHTAAPASNERPLTAEEIRAPFVHNHDSTESATLFESKVKASLRDVLAAMWEAEGLLRTVQPARALPAENRALELLKELQQADRVYVRRVGFDPAPLKINERRLHGELEAIPKSAATRAPSPNTDSGAAAVREALTLVSAGENGRLAAPTATSVELQLTAAAEREPARYLAALEIWRRRAAGISANDRAQLLSALWSVVPPAQPSPDRAADPSPELSRDYFMAVEGTQRKTR